MMSPSTDQGRVVVFGLMFDLPYAGIVAQFLHYLLGLRALGWDVWYVEDSLSWPYDPQTRTSALDPAEGIGRIASVLEKYGFGSRWIYRCAVPGTTVFGTASETLAEIYQTADLALNVTGAQVLRDEHRALRRLVYVQSDPFALQVDIDNGNRWAEEQLARHHVHFTFGELIGTPSCALPTVGHRWLPTRQPVALELWPVQPIGDRFTTVTTWHSTAKPKLWRGSQYYWSKDREFLSVIDLPRHTSAALELAIDGIPAEAEQLRRCGWTLLNRRDLTTDLGAYGAYINSSRGEFTVARDQVVRPRTGWFSDRSATYLAAGRPVVAQETGFSEVLPTGEGLFAFSRVDDAAAALETIEQHPSRHSAAARAIAEEYFSAERVLSNLLARADGP